MVSFETYNASGVLVLDEDPVGDAGIAIQTNAELLGDHLVATSGAHGITAFGSTVITAANAAAGRSALGLAAVAASGSASDLSAGTLPAARLPAEVVTRNASNGDVTISSVGSGNYHQVILNSVNSRQTALKFAHNGTSRFLFGMDVFGNGTQNFFVYDETTAKTRIFLQSGILYLGGDALSSPAMTIPAAGTSVSIAGQLTVGGATTVLGSTTITTGSLTFVTPGLYGFQINQTGYGDAASVYIHNLTDATGRNIRLDRYGHGSVTGNWTVGAALQVTGTSTFTGTTTHRAAPVVSVAGSSYTSLQYLVYNNANSVFTNNPPVATYFGATPVYYGIWGLQSYHAPSGTMKTVLHTVMTSSGYPRVGIGTTDPTDPLHVVGTGLFTDMLTSTGLQVSGATGDGVSVNGEGVDIPSINSGTAQALDVYAYVTRFNANEVNMQGGLITLEESSVNSSIRAVAGDVIITSGYSGNSIRLGSNGNALSLQGHALNMNDGSGTGGTTFKMDGGGIVGLASIACSVAMEGSSPGIGSPASLPTNVYGGDTVVMGEPTKWMTVTLDGVSYRIPLYLPA